MVTKSHADINQLRLSLHTWHLAQREVNQSRMELTISRILELTPFHLTIKNAGPDLLLCYITTMLM